MRETVAHLARLEVSQELKIGLPRQKETELFSYE